MLSIMKKAAIEAGEIQKKYFRKDGLDVTNKTDHQNIITIADRESQDVIKKTILESLLQKGISTQDIGFIGEEDLNTPVAKHMFVIDPIDGTSNFASGLDYFCSSIAYFLDGKLTAGLIYRPILNDLYFAELGKGSYLLRNGKETKLQILDLESKNQLIISNLWKTFHEKTIDIVDSLLPNYRGARILGAIALDIVLVAENIVGLTIGDIGPWIWDLSAAKLIIEEAGGGLYDWNGDLIKLDISNRMIQYPVLACHPSRVSKILTAIQD